MGICWTAAGALVAVGLLSAAATGAPSPPKMKRVVVHKTAHVLELWDARGPVARYAVAIGPGGPGEKHREGDKITPTGHYHVVSRGPSASFTLFMRLDYPNDDDRRRFREARAKGLLPKNATIGGDIGIHGGSPTGWAGRDVPAEQRDWTLGCIALEDAEILALAMRVADGTPVDIDDE